jgi:energy-converting hydrogenase Eha subunit H
VTDDAADTQGDDEKLPKPPIVIPWRGHLVVAIVCVIFAIGAATTKGLLGVAIAAALLALAAVDIRSGLHKRKIVEG